ncbi:molybdenum cofactor cytidylyltransferase [Vibrio sp. F74]|uniref:molybdenum cofactor cytidylyltransferase n=1 Tax=Vibrio sp. F74 TaxID=700020 RepID=UPI0035F5C8A3
MVQRQHVDCVMPAAGLSSRMGRWKMMLPYLHHTILDESIENALGFCTRVILVVGHRGGELAQRYQSNSNIVVVVNPGFEQGMFGSIQHGVKQVETDNFFICHGDMPCISADIYQRVWNERGQHTVFPGTVKAPGHPVLLCYSMAAEIANAPLDSKMKKLIQSGEVKYVGMKELEILFDIDTQDAYDALCRR